MLGVYHPFIWGSQRKEVDSMTVYQVETLDIILTGQVSSITLVNAATGASTGVTTSAHTWTVRGVTVQATRVTATLSDGVHYYLNIDGVYFSDIITKSTCNKVLRSFNSCANQYYDWDSDPVTLKIYLNDPQELAPQIETESETIITEY